MPDDCKILYESGFITIRLTPTMWRIRGWDEPYPAAPRHVDIFPFARKLKWQGQLEEYTDSLLSVSRYLRPYELPTPEQKEATRLWIEGLQGMYRRIGSPYVYPHSLL